MDRIRASQVGFVALAWGIVLALLAQVSLIGLWMFSGQPTLWLHREFGHAITFTVLALLALAFTGRLPRNMKLATALLFAVLVVQTEVFAFIAGSPARAFHTVLPLVIFALAVLIAVRARPILAGRATGPAFPRRRAAFPHAETLGSEER